MEDESLVCGGSWALVLALFSSLAPGQTTPPQWISTGGRGRFSSLWAIRQCLETYLAVTTGTVLLVSVGWRPGML